MLQRTVSILSLFVAVVLAGCQQSPSAVAEFQAEYGEEPATAYYAYNYDAANLPLGVIEGTPRQGENGTLHIGYQALRADLGAISGYKGLTGILACDQYGDYDEARFRAVRLVDPVAWLPRLADNVIFTYPAEP